MHLKHSKLIFMPLTLIIMMMVIETHANFVLFAELLIFNVERNEYFSFKAIATKLVMPVAVSCTVTLIKEPMSKLNLKIDLKAKDKNEALQPILFNATATASDLLPCLSSYYGITIPEDLFTNPKFIEEVPLANSNCWNVKVQIDNYDSIDIPIWIWNTSEKYPEMELNLTSSNRQQFISEKQSNGTTITNIDRNTNSSNVSLDSNQILQPNNTGLAAKDGEAKQRPFIGRKIIHRLLDAIFPFNNAGRYNIKANDQFKEFFMHLPTADRTTFIRMVVMEVAKLIPTQIYPDFEYEKELMDILYQKRNPYPSNQTVLYFAEEPAASFLKQKITSTRASIISTSNNTGSDDMYKEKSFFHLFLDQLMTSSYYKTDNVGILLIAPLLSSALFINLII